MHARSVGIEDAGDLDRQSVLPPIVEEQGFGAAFSFIIAGTRPDRIDTLPTGFSRSMRSTMATPWDSFSHGLIAHQSEPCRTFDCKHAVTSKGATERQANGLQVGHGRRELLSSTELITTLPEYAEPFIWSESRR